MFAVPASNIGKYTSGNRETFATIRFGFFAIDVDHGDADMDDGLVGEDGDEPTGVDQADFGSGALGEHGGEFGRDA